MKKLFILILFFCSFSLFALENTYPVIINNGTILINTGVGFGGLFKEEGDMKCPPLTASIDFALPLAGLPFTVGLITGYSSKANLLNTFLIASRIAYHQGFNIPNFDSYIVLTLGAKVASSDKKVWGGVSLGARYFFLPYLGAFAELGIDAVQVISFGVSFKL